MDPKKPIKGYLVDNVDRFTDTVETRWNINTLSRLLGGGPMSFCRVYLGPVPYRLVCHADMWECELPISSLDPKGEALTTGSIMLFGIDGLGYEKSLTEFEMTLLNEHTKIGTFKNNEGKWYNSYVIEPLSEQPYWGNEDNPL